MLIHEIIVTPYYVIYYNVTVNILMCYSNTTIVNMYSLYRKLVYKIIINRGGYRITYSVVGYWIYIYIYIYDQRNKCLAYKIELLDIVGKVIISCMLYACTWDGSGPGPHGRIDAVAREEHSRALYQCRLRAHGRSFLEFSACLRSPCVRNVSAIIRRSFFVGMYSTTYINSKLINY